MKKILDEKDKKILYELYQNARIPTTHLAKKVRLSREVVNYRIKNLESKDIIQGYYAVLDFSRNSYVVYRLLLKFNSISPEQEEQIIEELKAYDKISWIAQLKGPWDLVVLVQTKSVHDFITIYETVLSNYAEIIIKKSTMIVKSIYSLIPGIFGTNDTSFLKIGNQKEPVKTDKEDMVVLKMLSDNARINLVDIALKLDCTANAVRYKLKRLEKLGIVVGFRPKMNFNKLGYKNIKVFLYLNEYSIENLTKIRKFLLQSPYIYYITKSIGECDLEFEILVKDTLDLYIEIDKIRSAFPGLIKDFQTIFTLNEKRINFLPVFE